jgi:hypothetical protein
VSLRQYCETSIKECSDFLNNFCAILGQFFFSSGSNLRSAGLRNGTSANGKPSFAESGSLFLKQRQSTFSSFPRHTFPGLTSTSRLKRRHRGSEAGSTSERTSDAAQCIRAGTTGRNRGYVLPKPLHDILNLGKRYHALRFGIPNL